MKTFYQFVKKEFYHITRDYRTLLVLFGMPLAQLIIFGFAIRTDIKDAEIGILDYSKDNKTVELTNKILASGYFIKKAHILNTQQIDDAFKSGSIKEVIVFEDKFAEKLTKESRASIQIICDASDPNIARMLNTYTSSIIKDFQSDLNRGLPYSRFQVQTEIRMFYNPELKSVYMFVPGLIALILMLVSALMTSIAITKEKEFGSMEVLLVSPLKPQIIILGKVVPYITIALINSLSVLTLALLIFKVPFKGSFLIFLGESFLFILTALSLGIMISTIAKTQQVALMMSLAGLLMPTVLLSGFIFPIENMPAVLQYLSHLIPAKWFLVILKSNMLKGNGIEYYWKETLILFLMMTFYLLISVKKFKIRLE